jgi:hypothetical protein
MRCGYYLAFAARVVPVYGDVVVHAHHVVQLQLSWLQEAGRHRTGL